MKLIPTLIGLVIFILIMIAAAGIDGQLLAEGLL